MSKRRSQARRKALQALYQWQMSGNEVSEIERDFLQDQQMDKVDIDYFRELLQGVYCHHQELDSLFLDHLDRTHEQLDPIELALLRIATFELQYRVDVPFRAVINEAINLAKTFGAEQSHKFLNGVLDKVARQLRQQEVAARRNA